MNILLINHYAGSPDMGMEFRPYYLSREWVKMGHEVTIIAGDWSHLRVRNPKVSSDFSEEMIDGIRFVWVKTGEYEGNGVKRALTMFRFVRKLKSKARYLAGKYRPDVVICSSTYPLDTYVGQKIRDICGAKLIHEVHDMWPATLYEVGGMSKSNPFVKILQKAEDSAYTNSDHVVSLLPYAEEYMAAHGLSKGKFVNIQNGVVEEEWTDPDPLPEAQETFLRALRENNTFIVGYFGGHALSNALDVLLDAAKLTEDPDIHYVLVGKGVEKERLRERKKNEDITNLDFLDPVPKRAVASLLPYFDVSYMGAEDSPLYRFGVCFNKMYDSMMGAKPVIFAVTAPRTLIEEYDCGAVIPPGDPKALADTVLAMKAKTAEERTIIGNRGRDAITDSFTYGKLAKRFADLF